MKDTCPHAMLVAGNRSQQDARYVTQGQGCRHHSESWYRWWDVFGACGFNHDINLASIPKLQPCALSSNWCFQWPPVRVKESVPKRKLGKMPMLPQLRRRRLKKMTRFMRLDRHGVLTNFPPSQCPWGYFLATCFVFWVVPTGKHHPIISQFLQEAAKAERADK